MAAGKPAIKVSGAKEFRAAMKRMGADLGDLTAIHKRAADLVSDYARTIVRVLSGDMRGTIRGKATRTRGSVSMGGGRVVYAGVQHFGWPAHNITPDPVLYDAIEDKEDQVIDQYERHVEALVEKVGRETPP